MIQTPSVPSVLESAKLIATHARHVKISQSGVAKAARKLLGAMGSGGVAVVGNEGTGSVAAVVDPLEPPSLSENDTLEWLFLVDTLNFCFWSDEPTLFTVSYQGHQWTGYRSLCAALARAKEVSDQLAGLPIHAPSFYGGITLEQLCEIFRSETHVSIPLLERRRDVLHEVAAVLNQKFNGKVSDLICQSGKSAQKLIQLLATNFPCYCDISTYNRHTVSFLKRAQIFAADLWMQFGGQSHGEFHDIDSLTMFADYRVPQSLLYLDVLHYSDELMGRLVRGEHVEVGSTEEAEIRGCSIWVVELIKQQMLALQSQKHSDIPPPSPTSQWNTPPSPTSRKNAPPSATINSVMIDFYLWNYAKKNRNLMAHLPIHRTLTIFY